MKIVSMALIALAASLPGGALASSPFTDGLSRCLIESTTPADRIGLVRWLFVVESRHPAVAGSVRIPQSLIDRENQRMAALWTRLVGGVCLQPARQAYKVDGAAAFEQSFRALGELAGAEMFADPSVKRAVDGLQSYIDPQRIAPVLR